MVLQLVAGSDRWTECGIFDYWAITCTLNDHNGVIYSAEQKPVDYGMCHTFRIEIDPDTMTFTYYLDGQVIGSHVPDDAEKLKKAKFVPHMGIWNDSQEAVIGYVDDVRVGPIGQ
jgi:hypothetical protein